MKRILSLTLALVMILGTFTGVFAAEPTVEEAAAKFLAKEEILLGDDNGDLMLKDNLERRDAVILLSRLLGVEEVAAEFPTSEESPSWTDVRTDAYYVPFFAWAEANGYFEGNDDNTFAPREAISAPEYALVLLRALGYEVNGHESWKASLETAEKIGLLKDVEVEFEDKVVRGQMAVMTLNALGTKMKDSDKTLAEELGVELPEEPKAKELTAEVKDTENLAEVVVELSNVELVKNKEALTNPANYRLGKVNDDVKVHHVDLDGDNVILTLVPYGEVKDQVKFDSLTKGKKFELTIRNIDPAINKTYKGILAGDNEIPVVENVEFMGTYGIKVTTSEPIANPLERNFRLDSRTSMIVEQYGRDIILTPYHNREFDKDAVELTVDKLVDFAGYTSVRSVEAMELSTDDAAPEVEAAYRSGNKLTVVFDRDVYHESIGHYKNRRDLGNVSFVERRVTFYAETSKKVNTNVVEYTFEREIPKNTEVEIEGVANHFNKAMEKTPIVPVEYKDEHAPVVISSTKDVKVTKEYEAKIKELLDGKSDKEKRELLDEGQKVNTQAMTITFDKDIAEFVEYQRKDSGVSEADLVDHFILYELDVTRRGRVSKDEVEIKVAGVEDDKIKLTFEGIKLNNPSRDYDYVLEVRDFSDVNRNRMDREYLDFQVVRIADAFNVESIKIRKGGSFNRDGVEIVLEFNDYVNKEEASNARNYYLDGKLDVDEAIVERDGETVSLVIYDIKDEAKLLEKYEVLEISPRVENLDENATVADRFWSLATKKAITDPADVKGAIKAAEKAIADLPKVEELTLENKEDVEAARELVEKALKLDKTAEFDLEKLEAAEAKIAELEKEEPEVPEVPGDGDEEITAEVKEISDVFGIKTYEITLTNADAADVEKVLVNDVEVEDTEINEGKILFNVLDGSELELVQIVIDGEAIDVTIK